jgi:GTPase SAR1 family protein
MRHQSRLDSFAKTRDSERLLETLLKGPKCAFGIVFDVSDPASAFYLKEAVEPILRSGNPLLWIGTKKDLPVVLSGSKTLSSLYRPILDLPGEKDKTVAWVSSAGGELQSGLLKKSVPQSAGLDELLSKLRDISFSEVGAPRLPTYLVGLANAGKSQLLNALIERSTGRTNDTPLTVFPYPGTTLGPVSHSLSYGGKSGKYGDEKKEDALTLIDTPGITHPGQLTHLLTPQECVRFLPGLKIAKDSFVLRPGQSLLLGGLVRIDALEKIPKETHNKTALIITLSMSNKISRHVTKSDKVEALLSRHRSTDSKPVRLVPPLPGNDALPPMLPATQDFTISTDPSVPLTKRSYIEVGLMGIGMMQLTSRLTVSVRMSTLGGKGLAFLSPSSKLKLAEALQRSDGSVEEEKVESK